MERQHGISIVNRIFKINRFHPYHIHLNQHLEQRDFERRLQFYNWTLNQIRKNPHFIAEILFSDEAIFGNTGVLIIIIITLIKILAKEPRISKTIVY